MHKRITDYTLITLLAALFVVTVFACNISAFAQEAGGGLSEQAPPESTGDNAAGGSAVDPGTGAAANPAGGAPVDPVAGGAAPTMSTTGPVNDMGPGTAANIMQEWGFRNPNGQHFAATQYGGSDVILNGMSVGPGIVNQAASGPIQTWPVIIPFAKSQVPTLRDQAITRNLFRTFGYPVSDTQFQIIQRYNDNILLEQLFNPERVMWMTNAMGQLQATKTANNTANLAQNQATSAIEHVEVFLTNFANEAADPGNMWHQLLNNLFIPMAILLLFVGAVLAQVVAIAAQGTSVLGNVSPIDGLLRSVIAVFLIPFTQVAMSWCIDVGNSISQSIPTAYFTQFGRDMYQDAICAEKKAFPINPANNNLNAITPYNAPNANSGTIEGMDFDILGGWDPCSVAIPGIANTTVPDEAEQFVMSASRFMCNMGNSTLTMTWNVLCAFQTAYLYYLWCMGPIVAALWVWPMQQLRNAFPQWIEGLITLCFWSLFWNTSVLLLACFYGINTNGDTGTMYISALNLLSILSVKFAFNFSSLTTSLGFMAEGMAMNALGAQSGAGQRGGGGGAGANAASHGLAQGGAPGGLGAGMFVPGQHGGQFPGTGVPGTGVAAGTAGTGMAAGAGVAAGAGIAAGAGAGISGGAISTSGGLALNPDLTGGAMPGTGYGIGSGSSPYETNFPGSGSPVTMSPTSGEYALGSAGGSNLTPALSGTGAPGALNMNPSGFSSGGAIAPTGTPDQAITLSDHSLPGGAGGAMPPPFTTNPDLANTAPLGTSYDPSILGSGSGAITPTGTYNSDLAINPLGTSNDFSVLGANGPVTPGSDLDLGNTGNWVPGSTNLTSAELAGITAPPISYNPDQALGPNDTSMLGAAGGATMPGYYNSDQVITPGASADPSVLSSAGGTIASGSDPNLGATTNWVSDTSSSNWVTADSANVSAYDTAQTMQNYSTYPDPNSSSLTVNSQQTVWSGDGSGVSSTPTPAPAELQQANYSYYTPEQPMVIGSAEAQQATPAPMDTPPIVILPMSYPASASEYSYVSPPPPPQQASVPIQTVTQYPPTSVAFNSPPMMPPPPPVQAAPPPTPDADHSAPPQAQLAEQAESQYQQGSLYALMSGLQGRFRLQKVKEELRKRKPYDPNDGPPLA